MPPQGRLWAAGQGAGSHHRAPAPAAGLGSGISGGVGVGLWPVIPDVPKGGPRQEGRHQLRETTGHRGPGALSPACALGFTLRAASSGLGTALGLQGPLQVTFSPTPQGAAPAPLLHNILKLR